MGKVKAAVVEKGKVFYDSLVGCEGDVIEMKDFLDAYFQSQPTATVAATGGGCGVG